MRRPCSLWWLWPAAPLLGVVGSTLLLANWLPADTYTRAWRVPKEIDEGVTILLLAGVVAMVTGAALSAVAERDHRLRPVGAWPDLAPGTVEVMRRVYPFLVGATLFGYAVWILNGLSKGLTIDDVRTVLATQDNFKLPVKEKLETLPGITTLTQVAIPACVVGVVVDLHRPSARVRWAYRLVIALAIARAVMLAERLAVAELLLPVLILRAAAAFGRADLTRRRLLSLAPALAIVGLIVGFAASEYSRSWNWYADERDQDFVAFSSERLLGYYATSHNNGALLLNHASEIGDIPYYTTTFVWQVPPGSQFGGAFADDVSDERGQVLRDFGNPEFNSPSGLASVFADYGTLGGLIVFLAVGIVVGGVHISFLHGRAVGVLLYPVLYAGMLELPRYLYWAQGRATPWLAVSLVLLAFLGSGRVVRGNRFGGADRVAGAAV